MAAILLLPAAAVFTFQAFEIYSVAAFRSHVHQLTRLVLAWTLVFLLALAVAFFAKLDAVYSRLWAATWFCVGLAALLHRASRADARWCATGRATAG